MTEAERLEAIREWANAGAGGAWGRVALALAVLSLAPDAVAGQEWVRDATAGTITRTATIEGLVGYRAARAELMLRCRNRRADVAVVLYGGPSRSMPVGLARVDNSPVTAVNVETRLDPDGATTIALLAPLAPDGGSFRAALRAGLSLRVAVDFPALPDAVVFRTSLRGFTVQERRACIGRAE